MSPGVWVLLVAVVVALAFGGYRAATDGRFRGTHRIRHVEDGAPAAGAAGEGEGSRLEPAAAPAPVTGPASDSVWARVAAVVPEAQAGERGTLLQFSSAFCAPCRTTRRLLDDVATMVPGVAHVEVDAEHHLDLVRHLGIMRTPTTLVLDAGGHEVSRASGVPARPQVVAALGGLLES